MRTILLSLTVIVLTSLNGCSAFSGPDTSNLTVEEFKKQAEGTTWPENKFHEKFGKPVRAPITKDNMVIMSYKCKDGDAIVETQKTQYEMNKLINPQIRESSLKKS